MAPVDDPTRAVKDHYQVPGLLERILLALDQAGQGGGALRPEDLAPMDEFHIRGREATLDLARKAGLGPGMRVLDVGSGIGGPSRCLASTCGCVVIGVDLTDALCEVAEVLARRTGLSASVSYRQGDACDLPFEDSGFDVVWTQHTAMNIRDKPRLYRELARVLRPGGTLALYDVIAAGTAPIHLPVPWARDPEASHLATGPGLRGLLEDAGFQVRLWEDTTAGALRWYQAVSARAAQGPPPLGLHLMLGADFPTMVRNLGRNLEEGRIGTIQAVAVRPPASA